MYKMNWENINPQTIQLITQLLHLQTQLVNQSITGVSPAALIAAIGDYLNQLGALAEEDAK